MTWTYESCIPKRAASDNDEPNMSRLAGGNKIIDLKKKRFDSIKIEKYADLDND